MRISLILFCPLDGAISHRHVGGLHCPVKITMYTQFYTCRYVQGTRLRRAQSACVDALIIPREHMHGAVVRGDTYIPWFNNKYSVTCDFFVRFYLQLMCFNKKEFILNGSHQCELYLSAVCVYGIILLNLKRTALLEQL